MSKEGYGSEKKDGESKVVLERLQTYLKDKRSTDIVEPGFGYASKPSTSFDPNIHAPLPTLEDSSNLLKEILNHKKAELLRHPEVIALLKSVSADLKK